MRRILLILFLCSLLFIGAFVICAWIVLKLTFKHLNLVGLGGSTPFEPREVVMFCIGIAGVVASFTIHPYGAYRVRRDIRQLTSSAKLQTVIFVIFASFQVFLLALGYGAVATRSYIASQHTLKIIRAHQEVVATLDNANVEVIAKNARVISDDGRFVLAEVTLQIRNVPFSIPYYEMNIHQVGAEGLFRTAVVRQTDRSISNPYLRVTNRTDKWIFHDIFTNQDVSDSADNVVLRFEFSRVKAARHELPDRITPRLGIWARDDKVYYQDHIFFYKPIPVSFAE